MKEQKPFLVTDVKDSSQM